MEKKPVFKFNKKGGPKNLTLCHYAARMGYLKLLHELSKVIYPLHFRALWMYS